MNLNRFSVSYRCEVVPLIAAVLTLQCLLTAQTRSGEKHSSSGPSISVTVTPHAGKGGPDQTEPIAGTVSGVDVAKHKITVYAFAGGTWWVQPTVASPLTDIDSNGSWQTITHLGSTYAVLLVKGSYKPQATTSDVPKTGNGVLFVRLVQGK